MKKIFGRKPVLEAIKSGMNIEQVIVQFGAKGDVIYSIKNLAVKKGIKFSEMSPQKFSAYDNDINTQGVVALISDQKYFSFDELINEVKEKKNPLLLLLDSIQDPHNVGAILRTAECAGVDGVIITTHNSAPITEVVEKISAGAMSHLKICKVNNLVNVIKQLKDEGFWIGGSYLGENSKPYNKVDYSGSFAVIVGNEEKGIKPLVAKNCDFLIYIPMMGKIQSLNVSVATGVLLFEIAKQRMNN